MYLVGLHIYYTVFVIVTTGGADLHYKPLYLYMVKVWFRLNRTHKVTSKVRNWTDILSYYLVVINYRIP